MKKSKSYCPQNKRKDTLSTLIIIQHNKCAICEYEFNDKGMQPCLDHCHTTNRVREALCYNCNVALGKFKENKKILENAIAYLNKHDPENLVGF